MIDHHGTLFDADTHYYEPVDCFTRYIEPGKRHLAITAEHVGEPEETVSWMGNALPLIPPGFFDRALKPGSLKDMMRALKSGRSPEDAGIISNLLPQWVSRDERLAELDRQGVAGSFLFPTLGVLFEHHLRGHVEALYANIDAFNRWLEECWGFAHLDRLFAAPMVSLRDPVLAERCVASLLDRGARVLFMKTGHAHHRSPADPVFDRFWARVEEAGAVLAFHIGESGYNELYSVDFGEEPHPLPHAKSALQWASFYCDRPIMDTLSACILHNLFGRFPKLRLLSVENGSMWVPYLLAQLDKMKGMGRSGPWLGGRVDGRPSDIFKEHIVVSPYPEDDVVGLIELLGPRGVAMGSDFPHPEGAAAPDELIASVRHLDPPTQALFLGGNARRLIGIDEPVRS